jgi:Copper amine oxidase, enzyme domain
MAELKVKVEPWGPDRDEMDSAVAAALELPEVTRELEGAEHRVLSVTPVEPEPGPADDDVPDPTHVQATVYDYTNERTLVIDAALQGQDGVTVRETVKQPLPTAEEFDAAVDALSNDSELGPALENEELVPYRPMPPLVLDEQEDGTVARTISVGLRPAADDGEGHEIVGVRLAGPEVVRFEEGAPDSSRAERHACGVADAGQRTTDQGTPGRAKVTITRGSEKLWTLIAVRPAASAGTMGSGVELRRVAYRGKPVLRRAHVPILNVRYRNDACGPYRDWQYEEGMFKAAGADVAPGFRLCPGKAETVLESGEDQGNFRGVAIYVDGDEVVLVSELEAGWYRYISRWRLHADGTISPRFGFGAVKSSCVCRKHFHHAYWRLDFDVAGRAHNEVREFNDPPLGGGNKWRRLRNEIRRTRDGSRKRRWQVRNTQTGESYTLIPGGNDGKADAFGVGDMWALRHRPGQIDDGVGFSSDPAEARAHLNRFVNGESIRDTDVVLWYAAHFTHDVHEHEVGHIVGPKLVPDDW